MSPWPPSYGLAFLALPPPLPHFLPCFSPQNREQAAVYTVGDARLPSWGGMGMCGVWISRTGSSRWDSSAVRALLLGWYIVLVMTAFLLFF